MSSFKIRPISKIGVMLVNYVLWLQALAHHLHALYGITQVLCYYKHWFTSCMLYTVWLKYYSIYLVVAGWQCISGCGRLTVCIWLWQADSIYLVVTGWQYISGFGRLTVCIWLWQADSIYLVVAGWQYISGCGRLTVYIWFWQADGMYLVVAGWQYISGCGRLTVYIWLWQLTRALWGHKLDQHYICIPIYKLIHPTPQWGLAYGEFSSQITRTFLPN